jgi:hypothetical protein
MAVFPSKAFFEYNEFERRKRVGSERDEINARANGELALAAQALPRGERR